MKVTVITKAHREDGDDLSSHELDFSTVKAALDFVFEYTWFQGSDRHTSTVVKQSDYVGVQVRGPQGTAMIFTDDVLVTRSSVEFYMNAMAQHDDRDEAMETGETNTWREDIFPKPDIALPPDSQIIFLCKNEDGRIVSIKARAHDDCVQIHSPHGQIMITPSSSNWIKVQVSD